MKKINIIETALRDAHQSQFATRMTTEQMLPILETMDQAGYYALEAWGGATFDVCLRHLDENPWDRLRTIRKYVKNTKLQMLMRGQNLLGYTHYSDDVVEAFIGRSVDNGMDIIRLFDALNDLRNLETSFKAIKKYGGHAQGAICYTISPFHNMQYFANLAVDLESMGADSICIKDMAGILTPKIAADLVVAIKEVSSLPINMHTHATSGTGAMTYLDAVQIGADMIDTAISPLSDGTSQPPTETMHIVLSEMNFDTGLDGDKLVEIASYFKGIRKTFQDAKIFDDKVYQVNPLILEYQVPGGMLSNLIAQLKEVGAENRLDDVLAEVERVRSEVGYPPLVTPMSQIVGAQSVVNVLSGSRNTIIPNEMQDYVRGYYGQPAAPINPDFAEKILQGEKPISGRPADLLAPRLPSARKEIEHLRPSDESVISYAMFPEITKAYLERHQVTSEHGWANAGALG
jgi:oxaloacetate decarboxylase alpha subunit